MQGLIIAFIIISFIYKTYKNFTKESEKAARRTKDAEELQKAAERAKAVENNKKATYEREKKESFETTYDKAVDYTPTVFENSREFYKQEKAKQKENKAKKPTVQKPVMDYYNPEIPAEEVLANRRIHEPHKHGVKLPKKEKHVAADFNFRQALIYDAILRRPEY